MKVSGLGPFVVLSQVEAGAKETEQSIQKQNSSTRAVEGGVSARPDERREDDSTSGFIRIVDYLKKVERRPRRDEKRRRALASYHHISELEENLSQSGNGIDKKS